MLKLRLHGLSEEIARFKNFLDKCENVRVLSCSEAYADRGKSLYQRVYIDIEIFETDSQLDELLNALY